MVGLTLLGHRQQSEDRQKDNELCVHLDVFGVKRNLKRSSQQLAKFHFPFLSFVAAEDEDWVGFEPWHSRPAASSILLL